MTDIAGSQRGMAGEHDASDHGIAQVTWPAFSVPKCYEVGRLICGGSIECRDSLPHPFERSFKCLHEEQPALPLRHDLQFEANLQNRHGGCPDR